MKSKFAIISIVVVLLSFRAYYSDINDKPIMLTSYDALGYYTYLPGIFIYDDVRKLDWLQDVGIAYGISGDALNNYRLVDNGNKVNKYFCGVAIMQSPFFMVAHVLAEKKDGFSRPYQWAIVFASLFYGILGLILLRKTLLKMASDDVVALTLILITIASNIIQYIAIDCGLTHSYLFFLYCLVIYLSDRWHSEPKYYMSILLGACIGLAVCVRPTELLMVLIPLLWKYPADKSELHGLMKRDKNHLLLAGMSGAVMVIPQLLYWYHVTGNLIYDVGSKWSFANPFFRVLFGWEKGWFIYTPVTILFVLSVFFTKHQPFGKAIKWFVVLNIYVIISWFDWRYGGSYSTRALSQSYPLFGLSLVAMLSSIPNIFFKVLAWGLAPFLVLVNLVQVYQYNETIIHYNDMNKKYYQAIYMDFDPTPLDYSLLDTEDMPSQPSESKYDTLLISKNVIGPNLVDIDSSRMRGGEYLKTKLVLDVGAELWNTKCVVNILSGGQVVKSQRMRLNTPGWLESRSSTYEFFTQWPNECEDCSLKINLENGPIDNREIEYVELTQVQ